jgi:hypothetical protein
MYIRKEKQKRKSSEMAQHQNWCPFDHNIAQVMVNALVNEEVGVFKPPSNNWVVQRKNVLRNSKKSNLCPLCLILFISMTQSM